LNNKIESTLKSRKRTLAARQAALQARQLKGYTGGEKIGKHKVLEASVDVQLGEDLSENIRELKVSTCIVFDGVTPADLTTCSIRNSLKVTCSETDSVRCKAGLSWNPVSGSCKYRWRLEVD
jgi:hypothetical protein